MKIGEKVIKINNINLYSITTNKVYIIIDITTNKIREDDEYSKLLRKYYWINDDYSVKCGFPIKDSKIKTILGNKINYFDNIFITLKEHRRLKLKQINEQNIYNK